ncbi:unnamed protein product [Prorocentrum cordatum]|uniref:AB hydrolase-1 domain-containing protein n=1 Tax=Prorocentrum cordatum TaxID=2364126 RepID=A0ABN9S490_9DINO|nr:unnamed protein product [Polarella glacialis]|mmetsp:Transcript_92382/g.250641  ORF Transcript_92382/g.250641 Transcript_92382/m.250641 type:complete len:237 (-) Transcript_92382:126-836(-)
MRGGGREEAVRIPLPGGGEVCAKVVVQRSPVVVIATHPWGPLGGCMDDPHCRTVCGVMGEAGCSTARFNFRGGLGTGSSSIADVRAVAEWFTRPRPGESEALAAQVLLVGYSYGSLIAGAAAAEIPECIGFCLLGPPLGYTWALYLFNSASILRRVRESAGKPKLLVVGSSDQFCSAPQFRSFVETLPDPKESHVLEGVDHFGYFRLAQQMLTRWITDAFGAPDLPTFARVGPTTS